MKNTNLCWFKTFNFENKTSFEWHILCNIPVCWSYTTQNFGYYRSQLLFFFFFFEVDTRVCLSCVTKVLRSANTCVLESSFQKCTFTPKLSHIRTTMYGNCANHSCKRAYTLLLLTVTKIHSSTVAAKKIGPSILSLCWTHFFMKLFAISVC